MVSNFDRFDQISSELFSDFGFSFYEITYGKYYRVVPPNGNSFRFLFGSGDYVLTIDKDADIDNLEHILFLLKKQKDK